MSLKENTDITGSKSYLNRVKIGAVVRKAHGLLSEDQRVDVSETKQLKLGNSDRLTRVRQYKRGAIKH